MANLSKLIERFLRVAERHYWRHYQLEQITEGIIVESHKQDKLRGYHTDLSADVECLSQHQRNNSSARKALVKIGRALAVELERNNENSTDLLRFLNAADGGGGPKTASPLWQPLKADLQRIAIRSTLPPAGTTDNGGGFIGRLLAGREDVQLTPGELAFLSAYLKNTPLPLSKVQQEKKATGESATLARLYKLQAIRDYNRTLQDAVAPSALDPMTRDAEQPPTGTPEQSEGDGGARTSKPTSKRKRGRPADTDAKEDKRVYEAWKTGQHKTQADCDRELGLPAGETYAACERHRKRLERRNKRRRTK